MTKRTSVVIPAAMLAFSGLAIAGIALGSGPAHAQFAPAQVPCSGDVTDVDFCGWGGGGGGGPSPFGSGPGQVDLLPGVTENGPTDLTPGAATELTPGGGPQVDPGDPAPEEPVSPDYGPEGTFCIEGFCFPY